MNEATVAAIRKHAESQFPRESCGLIVVIKGKERYLECNNLAESAESHFALDPADYAMADDLGEIIGLVHSHPNELARPSEGDKVACEQSQLEWHIVHVSVPDDHYDPVATEIFSFSPSGYQAPLVGRSFVHGVLDCYSLVRDWYQREFFMELPDFERREKWWEKGDDLYADNFEACGFAPIQGAPKRGDIVLMQYRADVINHAAIYLGDGNILHHMFGRMSSRDVYGGQWQEVTRKFIRHRSVL